MRTITLALLLLIANLYNNSQVCLEIKATYNKVANPQIIHEEDDRPVNNILYVTQIGVVHNHDKEELNPLNLNVIQLEKEKIEIKMGLIQDIEKRIANLNTIFGIIEDLQKIESSTYLQLIPENMIQTLIALQNEILTRKSAEEEKLEQEINKTKKIENYNETMSLKLNRYIKTRAPADKFDYDHVLYRNIVKQLTENINIDKYLIEDADNLMNILQSIKDLKEKNSTSGDQGQHIASLEIIKKNIDDFYQNQLLIQERGLISPDLQMKINYLNKIDAQSSSDIYKQQTSNEYKYGIKSNRGLMELRQDVLNKIPKHMIPILMLGDKYDLCEQLFDAPRYQKWRVENIQLVKDITQTCCFKLGTEMKKNYEQMEQERINSKEKQIQEYRMIHEVTYEQAVQAVEDAIKPVMLTLDTYYENKKKQEASEFIFNEIDNINNLIIVLEKVDDSLYNNFKIRMYLPPHPADDNEDEQIKTLRMLI